MKAVFGFLGFVLIVIFVVIVFVRGGNREEVALQPSPRLAEAAASNANFRFTESGPIVAEEEHFRVEINVDRNSRQIIVYRGYNDVQVASRNFSNSEQAFEKFLSALDRQGYTIERSTSFDSEAGLCPTNRRFVFESNQFNESFRRWTTSCREKGNFGGDFATTRTLFRNQIPEYNAFIRETRASSGLRL